MIAISHRAIAIAAISALCACAQTPPAQTRAAQNMKSGALYIYEPPKPAGLAGPGEFTLTPDGQIHVSGAARTPQ